MGISDNIRKLRESKNLTQEQFGKIAGVSSMAVSQWENGRAIPRMGAIQRISDFFDVSKASIIGDDDPISDKSNLSDDEKRLLDIYERLNDTGKSLVLSLAQSIYREMMGSDISEAISAAVEKYRF